LGFALCFKNALRAADIPSVVLPLDHWQAEDMSWDRYRFETGFPFPVTLLVCEPELWDALLRQIPLAARVGGRVIGFCQSVAGIESLRSVDAIDEIWVPTAALRRRVEEIASCPVSCVVPPVSSAAASAASAEGSKPDTILRWFLAVDHGGGECHAQTTSATIECVRRLARVEDRQCGLRLLVAKDRFDLAVRVAHLPIQVEVVSSAGGEFAEVLKTCTGFVDLRTDPHVDPLMVEAALQGLPVVGAWNEMEAATRSSGVGDDPTGASPGTAEGAIELVVDAMQEVQAMRGLAFERAVGLGSNIAHAFHNPAKGEQIRKALRGAADGAAAPSVAGGTGRREKADDGSGGKL
jgi:hypothetical protein